VALTAFYALDQEHLDARYWELADTFAEMHALVADGKEGVARITVADLMLALEAWNHVDDEPQFRSHRHAVERIVAALGASAETVY
jgi:hypothetical protein